MTYLINHWFGKHPLSVSFWINFIAPLLLLDLVQLRLITSIVYNPEHLIIVSLGGLGVSRFVIYAWSIVGLIRSCDQHFLQVRTTTIIYSIQVVIVVSVIYTIAHTASIIQIVLSAKHQIEELSSPPTKIKTYKIGLQKQSTQLFISGVIDHGITHETRDLLDTEPRITSMLIDSTGGNIYEGRGLAKLVMEYSLNTLSMSECSSACITVFVAGNRRTLGANGKLGFHQYKANSGHHSSFMPIYDLIAEQQRDLAFIKARGIEEDFLRKVFQAPAKGIWFPNHDELLAAKIVHKILSTPVK